MNNTEPKVIMLSDYTGNFAENKDTAKKLRVKYLLPSLTKKEDIILDFTGIDSMTQSFTHALISDLIRNFGNDFFNKVSFKNCNPTVKRVIKIVAEYMQRSYNLSKEDEMIEQ